VRLVEDAMNVHARDLRSFKRSTSGAGGMDSGSKLPHPKHIIAYADW
jgi:hypothetical protein